MRYLLLKPISATSANMLTSIITPGLVEIDGIDYVFDDAIVWFSGGSTTIIAQNELNKYLILATEGSDLETLKLLYLNE